MKKILIICDYFAPVNKIASVRPTKFAKFIKKNYDFHVDVLTRETVKGTSLDNSTLADIKFIDNCIRIKDGPILDKATRIVRIIGRSLRGSRQYSEETKLPAQGENKVSPSTKSFRSRIKRYFSLRINQLLKIISSHWFASQAYRHILLDSKVESYDVLFSTYGEYSGHLFAAKYKRSHPDTIWIADFRDAVLSDKNGIISIAYSKLFQRHIVKKTDIVTAVSDGVLESLNIRNRRGYLIPNGYDSDDLKESDCTLLDPNMLTFVYCGQLYPGRSDFSLFFRSLAELNYEGSLDIDRICIDYAGNNGDEFIRQANEYGLGKIVKLHGIITRRESLDLQAGSSGLLLASWNQKGATGVITGKVYEQMLLRKPIICILTGDLPNSKLRQMIEEGNLGICCEYADLEWGKKQLRKYILDLYIEFRDTGKITYNPNNEFINNFDYANITDRLMKIIESNGGNIQ